MLLICICALQLDENLQALRAKVGHREPARCSWGSVLGETWYTVWPQMLTHLASRMEHVTPLLCCLHPCSLPPCSPHPCSLSHLMPSCSHGRWPVLPACSGAMCQQGGLVSCHAMSCHVPARRPFLVMPCVLPDGRCHAMCAVAIQLSSSSCRSLSHAGPLSHVMHHLTFR